MFASSKNFITSFQLHHRRLTSSIFLCVVIIFLIATTTTFSIAQSDVPVSSDIPSGSNSDMPSGPNSQSDSGSGNTPTTTPSATSTGPTTPRAGITVLNGNLRISYIWRQGNTIWWTLAAPIVDGTYFAVGLATNQASGMAGKGVACKQPSAAETTTVCTAITTTDGPRTTNKRTDDTPVVVQATTVGQDNGWVAVVVRMRSDLMDVTEGQRRVIFAIGPWDAAAEMPLQHTQRGDIMIDFTMETTTTRATTTTTTTATTPTTISGIVTTPTGSGMNSDSGSGSSTGTTATTQTTTVTTETTTASTQTTTATTTSTSTTAPSSPNTTMTTATTTTTTTVLNKAAAELPPMDWTVTPLAEAQSRGVLTFAAALMSPVIGPSGIFDTTRALVVFTFARCDYINYTEVKRASTNPVPFPEAIFPILAGGDANGYFRGALVANLIVVPLIFIVLTLGYGFYTERKKPGKLPPLPGPKPTTKFAIFWSKMCDWMYYGSTITFMVVIFALGFDGAISAMISMFTTTVKTADDAGDFVLSLLYIITVFPFLFRQARTIYLCTPTRFFTTPGMIRKKPGKKIEKQMPEAVADFLGGFWGRFFVVGDYVWRPGSVRSFRQLRECAMLFRRFHGPRDEDRAALAEEFAKMQAAAAAAAGVTPSIRVNPNGEENNNNNNNTNAADNAEPTNSGEENNAEQIQKGENSSSSKKVTEENPAVVAEEQSAAANQENRDEEEKKEGEQTEEEQNNSIEKKKAMLLARQKMMQAKQEQQQKSKKPLCEPINWKMFFRRAILTDFFFIEFIFVFFISAFKGAARVAETPEACFSLATASAVFNLFFFVFLLIIRPFVVPVRNILAIFSSFCAVIANFMVTSTGKEYAAEYNYAAIPATGLAVFAAILPIFYFLFTGVPRLMMRFVWGLQHAPGKQIPLRDPTKPPPPPEVLEAEKKRLEEQEKRAQMPLRELMKQSALEEPMLMGGASGDAAAQKQREPLVEGSPEWYAEQERIMEQQGLGTLSRIQKIFFPPPQHPLHSETSSYANDIGADLADSFGDDDDEDEYLSLANNNNNNNRHNRGETLLDEDDEDYLHRMLSQGGGARAVSPSSKFSQQRDQELQNVQFRVQSLQRQLEEAENTHNNAFSPSHGGNNNGFGRGNQASGATIMSPPRRAGFAPSSLSPPQQRQQQQQQHNTPSAARGMLPSFSPGSPQSRGRNPQIDQEMALAALLYQICNTRKNVAEL